MAEAGERVSASAARIVLAHEPPFLLGKARIEPSTRSVEACGRTEIIEPRMMQVLVTLARANGQVVTRDELVAICWEGRVVGEDALNRVLWRLRQLAGRLGPKGFVIETIPRVGYRLVADFVRTPAGRDFVSQARNGSQGLSRRGVAAGALAVAGVAAAASLAWATGQQRHEPLPQAKAYFDRAMQLRGQGIFSQSHQVMAYLREAVRIDPQYAEAWGALSLGYANELDWYAPRSDSNHLIIAARSASRRALELDPENADAAVAVLLLESPYGRWADAELGLRKVLAHHPSHHPTQASLASLMLETGRFTDAINMYRSLAEQEPFWPFVRSRLGEALLALGRLEEAEEQIEASSRMWPRHLGFWFIKIQYLLVSGQQSEAVRFASDPLARPIDADAIVERLILVAKAVADKSAASVQRARDALLAFARESDLAIAAMECPFIGEVDLAFRMYEGYFLDRGSWKSGPLERRYTSGLFKVETEALRRDVRFETIVREIGLDHYWRTAGVTPDYRRI